MRGKLNITLACALALMLFQLSACYRTGVPEKGRTLFVRIAGADLPVYLHGNDASEVVILLLHGGPGGNGLEYRSGTYAETLESNYIMAYMDQRGQGAARKTGGDYEVTMSQLIDDVDAVVKVLKAELGQDKKIYLLGHSWGGTLGTGYLLHDNHQTKIQGWIEADGAHDIPLLNRMAIQMFIEHGEAALKRNEHVEKWTEIVNWAKSVDVDQIDDETGGKINSYAYEVEGLIDSLGKQDEGGIPYRMLYSPVDPIISSITGRRTSNKLVADGIEDLAYTSQLNQLTLPVLLLWGKYDFVVSPELGRSALTHLGSSVKSMILFDHSGHSPMNTEAEAFASAIVSFVEKTK